MTVEDLRNRTSEEQSDLIASHEKISMREVMDNPEKFSDKILVFRGNYEEFDTNGLCIRTVKYITKEGKWLVSDTDLSDGFTEEYDKHFTNSDLEKNFPAFCASEGFLLDKE